MNKIEYIINCLDGTYTFAAEFNKIVLYGVETNIESLSSFVGELSEENSKKFIEEINNAQIEKWDREYKAEQSEIEDGITWKVIYTKDDKEYVSSGKESYVPYNHEHLINAILLCDKENDYLF